MPKITGNGKGREIIYDKVEVHICANCPGADMEPLSQEQIKKFLGWETESEYRKRIGNDKATFAKAKDENGHQLYPVFKDFNGEFVYCHRNARNRPFDETWALKQIPQIFLTGGWRFNAEGTFCVNCYGDVTSAQHRGIGAIIAEQMRLKDPEKYKDVWDGPIYLETLLSLGGPADEETLRTIDNTKPRKDEDTIFTSETYADVKDPVEKKRLGKMLSVATDFLWKRTRASEINTAEKYQTIQSSWHWRENHKRLEKLVKHVWQENGDRHISGPPGRIQEGIAAGMLYLMAASASDIDAYRTADPPSEKQLDFANEEKARQFWADYVREAMEWAAYVQLKEDGKPYKTPKDPQGFQALREMLGSLVESGAGGRTDEKCVVIAKAWTLYLEGEKFTLASLKPTYAKNPKTQETMLADEYERLGFGGIDAGSLDSRKKSDDDEKDESVSEEEAKEEQRRIDAEKMQASIKPAPATSALTAGWVPPKNGNGPKPDATPPKRQTRKQIEAEQTRKAAEADAAKAQTPTQKPKPVARKK